MCFHPREGADQYASYIGVPTPVDMVQGWNALQSTAGGEEPTKYILISPDGSGRTSEKHPGVPEQQIHVIRRESLPPLEGSLAWRQVEQLADLVGKQRPQGVATAWVEERIDVVRALAATPLRGGDQVVDNRIGQVLGRIHEAVDGPDGSLLTFTDPVAKVVDDFLSYRLTRTQASNILSVLFDKYVIGFPSTVEGNEIVDLLHQQIDYLISLASAISRDRQRYDLGSYAQLTYVGLLWADTALLMATQWAKRSQGENLVSGFEGRAKYVDELMAHDLAPSLDHPISLVPFGFVEYHRAETVGIIEPRGLYAGAGEVGKGPLDPKQTWARVQAYSAACDQLGTSNGAFRDFLSPALAEHLDDFLLIMKLGQLSS